MSLRRWQRWAARERSDATQALSNEGLPHRRWLAEYLAERVGDVSRARVLELGCSYGPNLIALGTIAPTWELFGIDISAMNIDVGRERLETLGEVGSNINLAVGDITHTLPFPNSSFNVVFTDAVLLYTNPVQVRRALREMTRVGNGIVVTLELTKRDGRFRASRTTDGWLHDYPALLRELADVQYVETLKLPPTLRSAGRWPTQGILSCATLAPSASAD